MELAYLARYKRAAADSGVAWLPGDPCQRLDPNDVTLPRQSRPSVPKTSPWGGGAMPMCRMPPAWPTVAREWLSPAAAPPPHPPEPLIG